MESHATRLAQALQDEAGESAGEDERVSKHTPGPWTAKRNSGQWWYVNAPNGDPTIGFRSWEALAEVYGCDDEPESGAEVAEANARLIAAAPDLLEALVELVAWVEMGDHDDDFVAPARAAIAKATGDAV